MNTAKLDRVALEAMLGSLRPKLHRYCARMAGSVIDGEDIVQETLIKALQAIDGDASVERPEQWLFRIAHNAAQDHLRRRQREQARMSETDIKDALEPFRRVTTEGRESPGTGLGLPLTKALAEANRARFAITSEALCRDDVGTLSGDVGLLPSVTGWALTARPGCPYRSYNVIGL